MWIIMLELLIQPIKPVTNVDAVKCYFFCLLLSLLTAMLSSFRCRRVIVKPCYARSVSQTTFMLDTDLTSARSTEIAWTARWQHVSGICWLAQFAHFMHVVWLFCFDSLRCAENGSVFVWVWVFFISAKHDCDVTWHDMLITVLRAVSISILDLILGWNFTKDGLAWICIHSGAHLKSALDWIYYLFI